MTNIARTIENTFKRGLRRIKLLVRGRGDTQTSYEGMPFGIDGIPPKGWKAVQVHTQEKGVSVVVGYINQAQIEGLVNGENRIYSTDSDGSLSTSIFLRVDGTMEIGGSGDFMVRYNELETAFQDLQSEHNDLVSAVNTMSSEIKAFATVYSPGGPAVIGLPPLFSFTSQNEPSSAADITSAKIEEIKTTPV